MEVVLLSIVKYKSLGCVELGMFRNEFVKCLHLKVAFRNVGLYVWFDKIREKCELLVGVELGKLFRYLKWVWKFK